MSSVRGLLEERERVARVAVEELQAEADRILAALGEAEMVLERRVIAREELSEALAVRRSLRSAKHVSWASAAGGGRLWARWLLYLAAVQRRLGRLGLLCTGMPLLPMAPAGRTVGRGRRH